MRKFLILLFTMAIAPALLPQQAAVVEAQCSSYTQVTGTVTDPNGVPYAYGKITATITPSGGGSPTCTGSDGLQHPFANPVGPAQLDAAGSFTMQLPPNSIISNGGSAWGFSVSITGNPPPIGTGPQQFSVSIAIAGGSQSISATLSAAALALSYGSSSAKAAPNQNAIYQSSNCGSQTNCYPIKLGNVCIGAAVGTTASSSSVTCSTANFSSADVGSTIFATINGFMGPFGFNASLALVQTTIQTVVNSTTVTVATNAAQTCSSNSACLLAWGPLQDTNIDAAETALQSLQSCGRLDYPTGFIFIQDAHFNVGANACKNGTLAFMLDNGEIVHGQGVASTVFVLVPNFNWSSCTGGLGGTSCFLSYNAGAGIGLSFTGFGSPESSDSSTHSLIGDSAGWEYLQNVFLTGFAWSSPNKIGLNLRNVWADNTQEDAFGYTGVSCTSGGSSSLCRLAGATSWAGDNTGEIVSNSGIMWMNNVGIGANTGATLVVGEDGAAPSVLYMSDDEIQAAHSGGIVGTDSTGTIFINDLDCQGIIASGATNADCIVAQNSGFVHVSHSTLASTGTGHDVLVQTSGNFFDDGFNTFLGTNTGLVSSGHAFGSASATGVALATGNVALTSGWGTSTVSAVSANSDDHSGTFTISLAGTIGTSNVITLTFPFAWPLRAPTSCQLFDMGGTGALPTSFATTTAPSTTSVAFTVAGTFAASTTEIFGYQCQ